jgi:hypothetical protein
LWLDWLFLDFFFRRGRFFLGLEGVHLRLQDFPSALNGHFWIKKALSLSKAVVFIVLIIFIVGVSKLSRSWFFGPTEDRETYDLMCAAQVAFTQKIIH